MSGRDTIVALASGQLPAGIAVVRFSGPMCGKVLRKFVQNPPKSRKMCLREVRDPGSGELIDEGLVVFFPGPDSFTGEDCLEFHLHGSVAVVRQVLDLASEIKGVRLAEPGEFTRKALENGRLDLLQTQGLGDLIAAQTESQRVQAIGRMRGGITTRVEGWRSRLLDILVQLEGQLDFSDEGDVGVLQPTRLCRELAGLRGEMAEVASTIEDGRIIREGFRVGLAGPPNVGKSSIINRLADSDIAIVTAEPGTTRDTREVFVDIDGQLVIFIDSAGLRDSDSEAERQGVRRARDMLSQCNLILWVGSVDVHSSEQVPEMDVEVLRISNKSDLGFAAKGRTDIAVSCKSGDGFEKLRQAVRCRLKGGGEAIFVSRLRDRQALESAMQCLLRARAVVGKEEGTASLELVAEEVRMACVAMERLLGRIDSEDVLDRLFSGFCIGK